MAFNPTDQFLLHRAGKDYRTTYSSFLDSLNLDLNISELDDSEVELIVNNILEGKNPDGTDNPNGKVYLKSGDDVSELFNDAGYMVSSDLVEGKGVTITNAATSTFDVKIDESGDKGLRFNIGRELIVDQNFIQQSNKVNDTLIGLTGGKGITTTEATGTAVSTNNAADTNTTFDVDIVDNGGLVFQSDKLAVDTDWVDGKLPTVNDATIALTGGDGIVATEASNNTLTTNNADDTNTTFKVDILADGGLAFEGASGSGQLRVADDYTPSLALDDLTDVEVPTPTENYILTYKGGEWVAEYNPIADTPIEFQTTIDVEGDNAPTDRGTASKPLRPGDLWIQAHISAGPRVAGLTWVGIVGETVQEGQYVMYGSDDLWHLGRTNDSLENVQSDWAETDINQLSFIQHKPVIYDTTITIGAGHGIDKTELKAPTTNQNTTNDTSLSVKPKLLHGIEVDSNGVGVKAGKGIELDANGVNAKAKASGGITVDDDGISTKIKASGGINVDDEGISIDPNYDFDTLVSTPGDGSLTITYGSTSHVFTANQDTNSTPIEVTIPQIQNTPITIGAGNGIIKTELKAPTTNQNTTNDTSLSVKPKLLHGIEVDSNGVGVKAGKGIELDANGVNAKAKASGGITVDDDGISIDSTFDFTSLVTINNGAIEVNAPSGATGALLFTGSNATANQENKTERFIDIDKTYFDGLYMPKTTVIGDASFIINNPKGDKVLGFSANQTVDEASPVVMFSQNNYIQHLSNLP